MNRNRGSLVRYHPYHLWDFFPWPQYNRHHITSNFTTSPKTENSSVARDVAVKWLVTVRINCVAMKQFFNSSS
jgi:hypothetical protein